MGFLFFGLHASDFLRGFDFLTFFGGQSFDVGEGSCSGLGCSGCGDSGSGGHGHVGCWFSFLFGLQFDLSLFSNKLSNSGFMR